MASLLWEFWVFLRADLGCKHSQTGILLAPSEWHTDTYRDAPTLTWEPQANKLPVYSVPPFMSEPGLYSGTGGWGR